MRSCCRFVCFCLLMDSNIPPRVGCAWWPLRRVVHFGPWCINRPVSQPLGWSAQGDQASGQLLELCINPLTPKPAVTVHATSILEGGFWLVPVPKARGKQLGEWSLRDPLG
ncbi:hypothetical protein AVEN_100057-1 [Araneus ventricosus]|uniref:Secreted protein n=1 Tax=Araneus ventricosus TaxID=182803 RepID=A0A4Y2QPQ3_ARAVE|nr:hypothetical protein AVEN_100057-1 [Araneus ventricosus]